MQSSKLPVWNAAEFVFFIRRCVVESVPTLISLLIYAERGEAGDSPAGNTHANVTRTCVWKQAREKPRNVGGMPCHPSHRRRASRTAPTTAQSRFAPSHERGPRKIKIPSFPSFGLHRPARLRLFCVSNRLSAARRAGIFLWWSQKRILSLRQRLPTSAISKAMLRICSGVIASKRLNASRK